MKSKELYNDLFYTTKLENLGEMDYFLGKFESAKLIHKERKIN